MDKVLNQWDRAASMYRSTQMRSADAQHNFNVIAERFSSFTKEKVLDAGCGYGYYAGYFAACGADVIGCDGSPAMLEYAREQYPAVRFDLVDLLHNLPYADNTFDLLFCNQVLMDLPEINGLIQEFARVLKPKGILYFSIVHPAFYPGKWIEDSAGNRVGKQISRYAESYEITHTFCGETTHFHRPISTYLNLVADYGFRLVSMDEPLHEAAGMPLFLFCEFEKDER